MQLPTQRACAFSRSLLSALALGATLVLVLALFPGRGVAQVGVNALTLEQRVAALESKVTNLQTRVGSLETKMVDQQRLNNTQINQILSLQATVQKQQRDNLAQGSQITVLANKLVHVSRSGDDLFITGANVHIRNGLGSTPTTNSLGNLIVGYNENAGSNDRTGSHNLVVGPEHTYSSYGGFVAGYQNKVTAIHASVSGGVLNTASGVSASVSGGFNRAALGNYDWRAGALFQELLVRTARLHIEGF